MDHKKSPGSAVQGMKDNPKFITNVHNLNHRFKSHKRKSIRAGFSPLPRNEAYEKNVLGCCIVNPSLIQKYDITSDFFYEERDRIIFNAVVQMLKEEKGIGDLEIWHYVRAKGLREKINKLCPGGSSLVYLANLVYNSIRGNTRNEVKTLREFAELRRKWELSYRIIQAIESGKRLDEIEEMKVGL